MLGTMKMTLEEEAFMDWVGVEASEEVAEPD